MMVVAIRIVPSFFRTQAKASKKTTVEDKNVDSLLDQVNTLLSEKQSNGLQ